MQHLKEYQHPEVQAISADIELMLARRQMDLPLILCFAAERGDDVLCSNCWSEVLIQMNWAEMGAQLWFDYSSVFLQCVNDSNIYAWIEGVIIHSYFMIQHLAASKGKLECVLLLLDSGAVLTVKVLIVVKLRILEILPVFWTLFTRIEWQNFLSAVLTF